ncbi:MAG: PASTA domain-containing protein [Balneolaceae bacterium]|nr:PASTA domain-containing protein [Balneolaceae bacterium]
MNERSSIMGRMFLLLGLLMLLPTAILVQILRVNFVEGEGLRELWNSQAIDFISIPAQRGNIYDSNGSLLVTDTAIYKVAVDPLLIRGTDAVRNIASVLSSHTGRSAQSYINRINSSPSRSQYLVLERSVPVQAYEDLTELGLRGLILEEEYRRNYNFESLAAHVVGFVNHNMDGMAGLESRYNNILRGSDGQQQVRKDRLNQIFAYVGAPRKLPKQGYSLHTTIDSKIQAIVEEELRDGVTRHLAKYGTAIVMDPKTGAIKAMANYPVYNPNAPATIENENRRNFAVADIIEPGSTFKLVTAIAAVEQNAVRFDEKFKTPENGQKMIHGQMMRDHDPLGTLSFAEVMAKSSNIATSEIAQRIPPNTFYQYARNMGFGTPSNIDLPGELAGRLQRPYEWSRVTLPWMSIGYEVQVSPIQLTQAYAAFANGGYLMKPYVVESITDEIGNVIERNQPKRVRRIARPSTIEKLLPVFEQAVSDSGTARWAAVDGLRIAGKTGTAQKFIDGRYQARYRASFVGFFPVEDPEFVILVLLDEPRSSIYGGFTAGSVFREIAQRVSGLQNSIQRTQPSDLIAESGQLVLPNLEGMTVSDAEILLQRSRIPYKTNGRGQYVTGQNPSAGEQIYRNSPIELQLADAASDSIPEGFARIPNLRDKNMRQAVYLLSKAGLEIEMVGSGTIYEQFPRAGDLMRKGRTVTVRGRAQSFNQQRNIVSN